MYPQYAAYPQPSVRRVSSGTRRLRSSRTARRCSCSASYTWHVPPGRQPMQRAAMQQMQRGTCHLASKCNVQQCNRCNVAHAHSKCNIERCNRCNVAAAFGRLSRRWRIPFHSAVALWPSQRNMSCCICARCMRHVADRRTRRAAHQIHRLRVVSTASTKAPKPNASHTRRTRVAHASHTRRTRVAHAAVPLAVSHAKPLSVRRTKPRTRRRQCRASAGPAQCQ